MLKMQDRIKRVIFVLCVVILLSACACSAGSASKIRSGEVLHIVVCWLKQPGDIDQRGKLISATENLKDIPGVLEIRAGEVLPSDRMAVDKSFDVAFVFRFKDEAALRSYEQNPIHVAAVEEVLKPLVSRIVIYDAR